LTLHLLWAIAPIILLSGILNIWSAVLNAGERFALAALCPIVVPAITISLLLGFGSWGIFALAAGLVCGAIAEMIILGVALHRQKISLRPKWYQFDANLRQVAGQYAPMTAGAFLFCSTSLVDQSMAAMLSPGSVAALNYGNRVIALPITLITTALSTAVIPYFSKMVSRQDWTGVLHTLKKYLRLIFIVTVLITGIILVFSQPIVQIVFQRGSFTAEDTNLVAQIQACYALQIPFYIANILVVRMISALLLNYILMYENIVNLIANIFLNYVFMQKIGITGIALSTSCVYFICFLMSLSALFFYLKKYSQVN
jgi:putative peptidoglycan lipid II flippase